MEQNRGKTDLKLKLFSEQSMIDPSQDEELQNLAQRTEDLLSRLDQLSNNLNSQLQRSSTTTPSSSSTAITQPTSNTFSSIHGGFTGSSSEPRFTSYPNFMTTRKTAIFTEQHYGNTFGESSSSTQANTAKPSTTGSTAYTPPEAASSPPPNASFRPRPEQNIGAQPSNSNPERDYRPISFQEINPNYNNYPPQNFSHFSAPEELYSTGSASTNYPGDSGSTAPPNRLTQRFSRAAKPSRDQEATDLEERRLKNRLQRMNNLKGGDALRWFVYLIPMFVLALPGVFLADQELTSEELAISCIFMAFALFFSCMASRLIEITEILRAINRRLVQNSLPSPLE